MNTKEIKSLLASRNYELALHKFEKIVFENSDKALYKEYLYFKRIAKSELSGKELLLIFPPSKRNEFIITHVNEFSACVDNIISNLLEQNIDTPITFLEKNTPTMESLINERLNDFQNSICLYADSSKNNESFFDHFHKYYDHYKDIFVSFTELDDHCPSGILFDKYPDPIQYCRNIFPLDPQIYYGMWIEYPESYYQDYVLSKNKKIKYIEVYISKWWKWNWFKKQNHEPDFTKIKTDSSLDIYSRGGIETDNIELEYTGRFHSIKSKEYYEVTIKVNRKKCFRGGFYEYSINPFNGLIDTIYREAENELRLKHGLPKIGEGWISEMRLYNLVKQYFPNALHQASPEWLKPQHLDIYIPYKKIAFEYQGRQHFEPINFFGGEKSFNNIIRLDALKKRKCKSKNVKLIYWRFDEQISEMKLNDKLQNIDINLPSSN